MSTHGKDGESCNMFFLLCRNSSPGRQIGMFWALNSKRLSLIYCKRNIIIFESFHYMTGNK